MLPGYEYGVVHRSLHNGNLRRYVLVKQACQVEGFEDDDDDDPKSQSHDENEPAPEPASQRSTGNVVHVGSSGEVAWPKVQENSRGTWANRLDFILSCIGYSVGLGNIWRFPYLCYANGGGAFLIPYFIMLMFCGVPLFFLEMSFGQYASLGPITIWKAVPLFKGIGYAMVITCALISIYYNVLISWSFFYLFASMKSELPWKHCNNTWNTPACRESKPHDQTNNNCSSLAGAVFNPLCLNLTDINNTFPATDDSNTTFKTPTEEYFHNYMLDVSDGVHNLGTVRWPIALCLLLSWCLLFLCLVKGIKSSGKVVYFTALFPYVILLVLLIGACLVEGALDGIKYYVIPNFTRLRDAKVWIDAAIQVVFSLGTSVGGLITLSSYSKFHNNCRRVTIITLTVDTLTSVLSGFVMFAMLGSMAHYYGRDIKTIADSEDAIVVACIDLVTSLFAGFVIFSILGVMAYNAGTTIDKVVSEGTGLAFIVYPEAVLHLPVPTLWSILFFLMLILLGIDSEFTFVETIVTAVIDEYPERLRRHRTWLCLGVCIALFFLGLPMTTQGGVYLLNLIDQSAIGWSILLIGVLECVVLSWVYGFEKMASDIELMIDFRPSFWWNLMWKCVTPGLILAFLLFSWITHQPIKYGDYSYPDWALILAYLTLPATLIAVPVCMVVLLAHTPGTLKERCKAMIHPSPDWGPALDIHRALLHNYIPDYISGGPLPTVTEEVASEVATSQDTLKTCTLSNGSIGKGSEGGADSVDHGSVNWEVEENAKRGNWTNRYEFVLTCLGYSVGLGNVWRFPYLCHRNGGGAFFIPYIVMMVLMGIPLYYLELVLGQYASVGPTLVWRCVPCLKGIGLGFVMISFYLGIYYNVVISWSLYYMFASLTSKLGWSTCDNEWNSANCSVNRFSDFNITLANDFSEVNDSVFTDVITSTFSPYGPDAPGNKPIPSLDMSKPRGPSEEYFLRHVLDISEGLHAMGTVRWHLALCLLLAWVLVFVCIIKGIKSAGKAAYLMATVPYLILLIFLIRALTLDGYAEGIQFYITPDWSRLGSAQVWYDAAVQVLFSLSTCYGGLIMLSSYNRFHNNCHRDAILVSLGDCATSIFAGFVIFATIGVMAKEMGTSIENVISSDVSLAFIVYPEAIIKLPAPAFWSFMFFLMLFLLGLDTQMVTVETLTVAVVEEFPRFFRKKLYVSLVICIVMYFLGLPLVTEGGIYLLQLFDEYITSWPVLVLALCETGAIAWFYRLSRLEDDIKSMVGMGLSGYWKATWLVLTPLVVMFVLVFAIVQYKPAMYGLYEYPWWGEMVAWILVGLALIPIPLYMVFKIIKTKGDGLQRIKNCMQPDPLWGPALEKHRFYAEFFTPGLKGGSSASTSTSEDMFSTPQSSRRVLPPADSIRSLHMLLGAEALQGVIGPSPKRLGDLRLGVHAGLIQHLHSVVDDVIIQRRPETPTTSEDKSIQTERLSTIQEHELELATIPDDTSTHSNTSCESREKRLSCVNMRAILGEKPGPAVLVVDQDSGPGGDTDSIGLEPSSPGCEENVVNELTAKPRIRHRSLGDRSSQSSRSSQTSYVTDEMMQTRL